MAAAPKAVALKKRERASIASYLESLATTAPPPAPPRPRAPAPISANGDAVRAALRKLKPDDAARESLPAFKHRDEILDCCSREVAVIRGATGCGKSTQVPRLLAEAAASRGDEHVRVVVCEPRRLAATALATRVAAELRDAVGNVSGYAVKGERKGGAATAVEYVTTGLFLRRLADGFAGATHVVIDEVHERSADTDLVLLALKRAVAAGTAPKIALMSATVDVEPLRAYTEAERTALPVGFFERMRVSSPEQPERDKEYPKRYFAAAGASVASVDVPGRTFPVDVLHLEEVLPRLPGFDVAVGGAGARDRPRPDAPSRTRAAAAAEAADAAEAAAADADAAAPGSTKAATLADRAAAARRVAAGFSRGVGADADDWLEGLGAQGARDALGRAGDVLRRLDLGARVNEPLVRALVAGIAGGAVDGGGGAILVFVPGVREIEAVTAAVETLPKVVVLPLHGRQSVADQAKAFKPAPGRATKVVVATDVAEASVTIPDVTAVVDCGLSRGVVAEDGSYARRLVTTRLAGDSAAQRAGRAGRVRPGVCFRLWCGVRAPRRNHKRVE